MKNVKKLAGIFLGLSLGLALSPANSSDQAQQYVGDWQVTRIMQPHKLPYYPRDCSNPSKIRKITATSDSQIVIHNGTDALAYNVVVEKQKVYFQSSKRRQPIDWVVSSDTFLHGVGVVWEAYRRCGSSD